MIDRDAFRFTPVREEPRAPAPPEHVPAPRTEAGPRPAARARARARARLLAWRAFDGRR